MNSELLKGMKRLMVVMNNNPDNRCPICKDQFDINASNYQPVWSDYYDNIVCMDCNATAIRSDESGLA